MLKFSPRCTNNQRLTYISAEGYMKPCCWRDPVNDIFNDPKYNLNIVSMETAVENINAWLEEEVSKPIECVDECCKRHCVYNRVVEHDIHSSY